MFQKTPPLDPTPIAQTEGYRSPTRRILRALQGILGAAISYGSQASAPHPFSRVRKGQGLGFRTGGAKGLLQDRKVALGFWVQDMTGEVRGRACLNEYV
jgi:hypothetical protein